MKQTSIKKNKPLASSYMHTNFPFHRYIYIDMNEREKERQREREGGRKIYGRSFIIYSMEEMSEIVGFPASLNLELDQSCGQVPKKEPPPSIREV